jgi:hypothetical protein
MVVQPIASSLLLAALTFRTFPLSRAWHARLSSTVLCSKHPPPLPHPAHRLTGWYPFKFKATFL